MDEQSGRIEGSLAGVMRGLTGKPSTCLSTHTTAEGRVYRCAGIVCPMFPGSHKAWAVDVTWTDAEADW